MHNTMESIKPWLKYFNLIGFIIGERSTILNSKFERFVFFTYVYRKKVIILNVLASTGYIGGVQTAEPSNDNPTYFTPE